MSVKGVYSHASSGMSSEGSLLRGMEQPILPFRSFVKKAAPLKICQRPLPPLPSNHQGQRRTSSVYGQLAASVSATTLSRSVSNSSLLTPIFLHPTTFSQSTSCLPEQKSENVPLLEARVYHPPATLPSPLQLPPAEAYLQNAAYAPSFETLASSPPPSSLENFGCDEPPSPFLPHEVLRKIHVDGNSDWEQRGRSRRPRSLIRDHGNDDGSRISSGSASRTPRNRGRVQKKDFAVLKTSRSCSPLHGPIRTRDHPPSAQASSVSDGYNASIISDNSAYSSEGEDIDSKTSAAAVALEASSDYHRILTERYRDESQQHQHTFEHEQLLASTLPLSKSTVHSKDLSTSTAHLIPSPLFAGFHRAHRKTLSTASEMLSLKTKTRQLNAEPTTAQRMRAAIPIQIPNVRRKKAAPAATTRPETRPLPLPHTQTSPTCPAATPMHAAQSSSPDTDMAYVALGPMQTRPARTPELQSQSFQDRHIPSSSANDSTPLPPPPTTSPTSRTLSSRRRALYAKGSDLMSAGIMGSSIRALGQLGGEETRQERRREELKRTIKLVGSVDPRSVSFKVSDLPGRADL